MTVATPRSTRPTLDTHAVLWGMSGMTGRRTLHTKRIFWFIGTTRTMRTDPVADAHHTQYSLTNGQEKSTVFCQTGTLSTGFAQGIVENPTVRNGLGWTKMDDALT